MQPFALVRVSSRSLRRLSGVNAMASQYYILSPMNSRGSSRSFVKTYQSSKAICMTEVIGHMHPDCVECLAREFDLWKSL